ncbi:cell division protein ZapE [Gammaproteobacteria bacterium]|nr:cell division protein ZapE [Gammaproteobacteria bacterium]
MALGKPLRRRWRSTVLAAADSMGARLPPCLPVSPVDPLPTQYQRAVDSGAITRDLLQVEAVEALEQIRLMLIDAPESPSPGLFGRFFSRKRVAREPVKGLYLWGGVGRGKTWLMDLFFSTLPFAGKKRLHFYRFMLQIHDQLHELKHQKDPLATIAERWATDTRVLCFDEFVVSDIVDAMVLGRLFQRFFDHGITVVATSNIAPDDLYLDGLQREQFVPAIEAIKRYTKVMHLDSPIDYRRRALEQNEVWMLGGDREARMAELFARLAPSAIEHGALMTVNNRHLRTRQLADSIAWFDFSELCEGARSAADYVELVSTCNTLFVSDVPQMDTLQDDAARRFIALIDESYDHGVKIVASADAPIAEIYQGKRLQQPFERTVSRLLEMQSSDYLATAHRVSVDASPRVAEE